MRRIIAVVRKEIHHILRDPRSLTVAVIMPMMMVLIFGYAINLELNELGIGVLDHDNSVSSRNLIRELTSSGFIVEAARLNSSKEIDPGFRQNKFLAALVIPKGYEQSILTKPETQIQMIIDGADGATASSVSNYLSAVVNRLNLQVNTEVSDGKSFPIDALSRIWFNPELKSANFIVPGLVAVVLMMICAMLTSIAVAREKETGTMEQILTTPIAARDVIIGKLLPYLLLGAIDAALILLAGKFLFHVPMEGSWLALAAYSLVYLVIALALGLLISTLVETQQVAMMVALIMTLLPTMLLSGFIFAHSSMPLVLQWVGKIIPATYYLKVIRGIMLIGRTWFPLEGGVMMAMAIGLLALAMKRFKSRLE